MKEHFDKYRHRLTDTEKEAIWRELPTDEAALAARRKRQFFTGLSVAGASVVAVLGFAVLYDWQPNNLSRFDRVAIHDGDVDPFFAKDLDSEIAESVTTPAERERLAVAAGEKRLAAAGGEGSDPVDALAGGDEDLMMTAAPEAFPLGAVADALAPLAEREANASRAGPEADAPTFARAIGRNDEAAPPAVSEETTTVVASPSDRRGPAAVRQAGKGMRSEDVTLPAGEAKKTAAADSGRGATIAKSLYGFEAERAAEARDDKMKSLVDVADGEATTPVLTGAAREAEMKTGVAEGQRLGSTLGTATVSGRVYDAKSGQAVPLARIVAVGQSRGTIGLRDGTFSFQLPCGTYTLEIMAVGYNVVEIANVKVCGEAMAPFEIALHPLEGADLDRALQLESQVGDALARHDGKLKDERERKDPYSSVKSGDPMPGTAETGTASGDKKSLGERLSGSVKALFGGNGAQNMAAPTEQRYMADLREEDREGRGHRQPRRRRCWIPPGWNPPNGEAYDTVFFEHYGVNPFIMTEDDALSTFAIDVDTASYTIMRRYLDDGNYPPADAIRVEEFVNFFGQGYEAPRKGDFAIRVDGMASPFGDGYHLVRVGIQGRVVDVKDRKPANLIFVIDTSGSMNRENRLGLVKRALHILLDELEQSDTVGIVEYGSQGRVVLRPTSLEDRRDIERAIDSLHPNGSTNAEEGLELAYEMASRIYSKKTINRLILCSDGVANTGETQAERILDKVRYQSDRGIMLSTIGFGMGNYNDVLMEKLADKGDGNYYYVDQVEEAERVFRENLTGTLQTIARDAKIQVQFDPEHVSRYRLLGYENRDVADEDFRNDAVDAGEVGAGHTVTALYEVKLNWNGSADRERGKRRADLGVVRVRYEKPEHEGRDGGEVVEIEQPITLGAVAGNYERADARLKVAAVAAEFAEILRESFWAKGSSLSNLAELAEDLDDDLRDEDVRELARLIGRAERLHAREGGRR